MRYRFQRVAEAERYYRAFTIKLARVEYANAESDIKAAEELSPGNAYYLACGALLNARTVQAKLAPVNFLHNDFSLDAEDNARIKRAIEAYEHALKLNPGDAGWYHNLGWLYWSSGNQSQAARSLQTAVKLDGGNYLYHVSLGLFYEAHQRDEEALRQYSSSLRLSPGILDSQFFADLRTRLPVESQRIIDDNIELLRAEVEKSGDPILKGKLGKLSSALDDRREALRMLQEATATLPGLSRSWINLGRLYEQAGKQREAITCYGKARFLDRFDYLPWAYMGDIAYAQDRTADAAYDYQRALNGWQNLTLEHAAWVSRIYKVEPAVTNDVVPQWLLAYCQPEIDVPGMCAIVVQFYHKNGNEDGAQRLEAICRGVKDYKM